MKTMIEQLRSLFLYCGVTREEYNEARKASYRADFDNWRLIHMIMAIVFAAVGIADMVVGYDVQMMYLICALFSYSLIVTILFRFFLKPDGVAGRILIYISATGLIEFSVRVGLTASINPVVSFVAMLILLGVFITERPLILSVYFVLMTLCFLHRMSSAGIPSEIIDSNRYYVIVFCVVASAVQLYTTVVMMRDIVHRMQVEAERDTDALTGLLGKIAMEKMTEIYINQSEHSGCTMMVMDLDCFKEINDLYGHDVGDRILREVGEYLKNCFRAGDLKCRFGGDEFIVFFPGLSREDVISRHAENLISYINKEIAVAPGDEGVGVSIGIACVRPGEKLNYREVFKRADIALYKAKRAGKNCYVIYGKSES